MLLVLPNAIHLILLAGLSTSHLASAAPQDRGVKRKNDGLLDDAQVTHKSAPSSDARPSLDTSELQDPAESSDLSLHLQPPDAAAFAAAGYLPPSLESWSVSDIIDDVAAQSINGSAGAAAMAASPTLDEGVVSVKIEAAGILEGLAASAAQPDAQSQPAAAAQVAAAIQPGAHDFTPTSKKQWLDASRRMLGGHLQTRNSSRNAYWYVYYAQRLVAEIKEVTAIQIDYNAPDVKVKFVNAARRQVSRQASKMIQIHAQDFFRARNTIGISNSNDLQVAVEVRLTPLGELSEPSPFGRSNRVKIFNVEGYNSQAAWELFLNSKERIAAMREVDTMFEEHSALLRVDTKAIGEAILAGRQPPEEQASRLKRVKDEALYHESQVAHWQTQVKLLEIEVQAEVAAGLEAGN